MFNLIFKLVIVSLIIIFLFLFILNVYTMMTVNELEAFADMKMAWYSNEIANENSLDMDYGEIEETELHYQGNDVAPENPDWYRRTMKANTGRVNTPYVYDYSYTGDPNHGVSP